MKLLAAALLILATFSGAVLAAEIVDGRMVFPSKNGNVLFDHQKHIRIVKENCEVCHERSGGIKAFGRAYAHDVCIGCHQPKGEDPGGPILCEGCHSNS
jgi:hypothetical protein